MIAAACLLLEVVQIQFSTICLVAALQMLFDSKICYIACSLQDTACFSTVNSGIPHYKLCLLCEADQTDRTLLAGKQRRKVQRFCSSPKLVCRILSDLTYLTMPLLEWLSLMILLS